MECNKMEEPDFFKIFSERDSRKKTEDVPDFIEIYSRKNKPQENTFREKDGQFNWNRFLGENLAKSAFDTTDFADFLTRLSAKAVGPLTRVAGAFSESAQPRGHFIKNEQGEYERVPESLPTEEEKEEFQNVLDNPTLGQRGIEALKEKGIDLNSQGEGETLGQQVAGKMVRYGGISLLNAPVALAKTGKAAVTSAIKYGLPAVKKVLKEAFIKTAPEVARKTLSDAGSLGTIGALTGALDYAEVPPLVSTVAGLGAGYGLSKVPGIAKKILAPGEPSLANLSSNEKRVSDLYKNWVGEEQIPKAIENINNAPQYPLTGYKPITGEIAQNPDIAQLHRIRQEIPSSGIAAANIKNNDKIGYALEEAAAGAIDSREVPKALSDELKTRTQFRKESTAPLYEKVNSITEKIVPEQAENYFKESIEKGKTQKSLKSAYESTLPNKKVSKDPEMATKLKSYYNALKDAEKFNGTPVYEKIMSSLKKPNIKGGTEVRELHKARVNINDMIEESYRKGQKNTARVLKEFRDNLDLDLQKNPNLKEADSLFKKLSEPVNQIDKNDYLVSLIENRSNNVMPFIFSTKSSENMQSIKNVLRGTPKVWEGFKSAAVNHFKEKISKSGGMSYAETRKFIKNHDEALKELLTEQQYNLINETYAALAGRSGKKGAEVLGHGSNSATFGRERTQKDLEKALKLTDEEAAGLSAQSIGKKAVDYLGSKAGIGMLVKNWAHSNEQKIMRVLDKTLTDPEYAKKLMSYKPSNQKDFNTFMNASLKSAPQAYRNKDKEEE